MEVDESYFGAIRVRGKRGRGALGKTIVFGILKRQGKVYTEIVPYVSKKQLQDVIRGKVALDIVLFTLMDGEDTMDWSMLVMKSTIEYIMVIMSLQGAIVISMALNHFGHMPKEG